MSFCKVRWLCRKVEFLKENDGCNSTRGSHHLVDEGMKQRSNISTLIYIITENEELELLSLFLFGCISGLICWLLPQKPKPFLQVLLL